MQKQKIETTIYLVLQSSYDNIEIALFNENQILGKRTINKIYASRDLILNIDFLLKENHLNIEDLTFTVVNQGPGPFTTLRVVIVTANALNFGGNLPIIGVDGLEAIILENENDKYPVTVALLNAFNNDVYYAIQDTSEIEKGWKNIEIFLNELKTKYPNEQIRFVGNAVDMFKNEIINICSNVNFEEPNPKMPSIEQIAKLGYKNWELMTNVTDEINPLYLKDAIRFKKEEFA